MNAKQHFSIETHNCLQFEKNFEANDVKCVEKKNKDTKKCDFCEVKISNVLEITKCDMCSLIFCLNHRHPEGHKCKVLNEQESKRNVVEVKKRANKVVDAPKGTKGAKNEALAKRVAFMKLKQTAKGVASLPVEERVYFNVTFEENTKPFYLSKEWTIGKCVDWLANQFN
ncbi:AN1-type zinc finger protein 1-like protein, partial [Leptotrombidium deliense]